MSHQWYCTSFYCVLYLLKSTIPCDMSPLHTYIHSTSHLFSAHKISVHIHPRQLSIFWFFIFYFLFFIFYFLFFIFYFLFFIFYFLFFIFFIRPKFQPRTHKHHFLIFNFFQIFVFHSTQIPNPICTHSVISFILRFLQLTHHSTNSKRCSTMIFMFKILQ